MKNALKKAAVFLTGISLLLNLCVPIIAGTTADPQVTLTLNKKSVGRGGEISVTVNVDPATTLGGNFDIEYTNLEYVRAEETANIRSIEFGQPTSRASDVIHPIVTPESGCAVVQLGTYYFSVPEDATAGTYTIRLSSILVAYAGQSTPVSVGNVEASILVEDRVESQNWQATLSGPTTAAPGTEITYSIEVTGASFSAAQLELTYDSGRLLPGENDNIWSIGDGTAKLVDHGKAKTTPHTYSLNMQTASTEGNATVTLTYAAFGTSESAVGEDLTPATITKDTVTTAIHKSSYSVTFQGDNGISTDGATAVNYGSSYTFTIINADKAYYNYTVTATMGGTEVEVTDGKDGSYTIPNVTGELVITITRTPKKFSVSFIKANPSMNIKLPTDETATYGTKYTYELPSEDGYTLGVSVTIGGEAYTGFTLENSTLTIPDTAIKDEIVITVRRTTVPVSVVGSGAEDVVPYEKNATVGEPYTLTVTQDSNYDYTVTATAGGSKTDVTNNGDGTYTIQKVTDAGELVFTVNKNVKTNDVKVSEYVKCDGSTCWLVVKECDKLSSGVYAYQDTKMFWSDEYEGYCYLVISTDEPAVSASDLSIVSGSATTVAYTGDVNMTQKIDANDAQLVYDLYNATYGDFIKVSMEKFLRADVNCDKCVDTTDAAAVVSMILSK